jgi:hypothetical protein
MKASASFLKKSSKKLLLIGRMSAGRAKTPRTKFACFFCSQKAVLARNV